MMPIRHISMLMPLLIVCCIASCSNHKEQEILNHAESLMEAHPDSALTILEGIEKSELISQEEKARYAILMSMALDKNYIDTTSFDVLQPAIDHYLKNGSPNEKLRTYYYQGRIFQNMGDKDNALFSFIKGIDVASESNDSLTMARLLVAQGGLYNEFYDFDSYTSCHLRAAKIYKDLSLEWHEFDCLLNALNGATVSGNKATADSLLSLCGKIENLDNSQKIAFTKHQLSYALRFNDQHQIKNLIELLGDESNLDTDVLLNLTLAYNKVGDDVKAKYLLDYVKHGYAYDTLKYQAISVPILEKMGNYKEALSVYKAFSHSMDSINTLRFDQKAKSVEDKHHLELQAQSEVRERAKITWSLIGGIIILTLCILILILLIRSNKAKKDLALQKVKTSELENKRLQSENELAHQKTKATLLENEKLKTERENLSLENKNLQLERDKKALEAENLSHRVEILESESESLKALLDTPEEIPQEVQDAIQIRIEMLNSLLASHITNNYQYEKPYETWVKDLTVNTAEFMNSNRLAFQASHPRFIQYFNDHNLSIDEINYVCLYAIGLRGKEVGNYMKKRSHVNISSAIRKKLGIDKHETNIGIYVRKLLKEL